MRPRPMLLAVAALMVLTVLAAQLSTVAFVLAGALLLALLGVLTLRWPRAMLVALVLSPAIIDLYAGQRLLPEGAQVVARFFSESLLMVVALVVATAAARRGTLVSALIHPFSAALAFFLLAMTVSAAVNAVPPQVAATGLIFTLDAAVLFYLPRMVGFTNDEARRTMWAVAIAVVITSLIGVGQAILTPELLGVTPVTGLSGEGVRFGSLVRDPNILGTLIGLALPFTVFSLVRLPPGRRRWLVGGAVLALLVALLLTYSRGSWLGVALGFGGVALIIDRRALVAFAAILVLAYATAVVMPKGILVGLGQTYDPFATTVNRFGAIAERRDLRTLFVRNALPIIEDHPWLGVGPGRYGGAAASLFRSPVHYEYHTDKLLTDQETVDNFWLHMTVEGGAVGVFAFLAMVGTAVLTPIQALRGARGSYFTVPAGVVSATAVVCVATVSTMLLEGNTAAFLFWFMLGLGSLSMPGIRTAALGGSATPSAG
jgi:O-antigen ligase